MKNLFLLIAFIGITSFASAQGNLQFNQVINLKRGDSYQVPTNKVLKIESISIQSNSLCMPRTGTQTFSCSGGVTKTEGLYSGFTYLILGDLVYSVPNQRGRNLFGSANACLAGNNTNPSCYPIYNIDLGQIIVPIWLMQNKQISINNTSISLLITAIEFNIITN